MPALVWLSGVKSARAKRTSILFPKKNVKTSWKKMPLTEKTHKICHLQIFEYQIYANVGCVPELWWTEPTNRYIHKTRWLAFLTHTDNPRISGWFAKFTKQFNHFRYHPILHFWDLSSSSLCSCLLCIFVSVIAQNVFPTGQFCDICSDWICFLLSSIVVSSWI